MRCLSWESPDIARLALVLTGKRAHNVRGTRARNASLTQGSELELQDSGRFRPTAQETWRRDWPKRRSRDCDVTCSNENSLKKLTHYGDRDDTPLDLRILCGNPWEPVRHFHEVFDDFPVKLNADYMRNNFNPYLVHISHSQHIARLVPTPLFKVMDVGWAEADIEMDAEQRSSQLDEDQLREMEKMLNKVVPWTPTAGWWDAGTIVARKKDGLTSTTFQCSPEVLPGHLYRFYAELRGRNNQQPLSPSDLTGVRAGLQRGLIACATATWHHEISGVFEGQ